MDDLRAKIAPQSEENINVDKFIECDELDAQIGEKTAVAYEMLLDLKDGERLTRRDLVFRLKLPDRTCRGIIEDLRRSGVRVCSGGGAPGYYLARTDEEYRDFEREYLSRAYKALATAKRMRESNGGQMKINV